MSLFMLSHVVLPKNRNLKLSWVHCFSWLVASWNLIERVLWNERKLWSFPTHINLIHNGSAGVFFAFRFDYSSWRREYGVEFGGCLLLTQDKRLWNEKNFLFNTRENYRIRFALTKMSNFLKWKGLMNNIYINLFYLNLIRSKNYN